MLLKLIELARPADGTWPVWIGLAVLALVVLYYLWPGRRRGQYMSTQLDYGLRREEQDERRSSRD
jgi:hypothetical protein